MTLLFAGVSHPGPTPHTYTPRMHAYSLSLSLTHTHTHKHTDRHTHTCALVHCPPTPLKAQLDLSSLLASLSPAGAVPSGPPLAPLASHLELHVLDPDTGEAEPEVYGELCLACWAVEGGNKGKWMGQRRRGGGGLGIWDLCVL